MDRNTSPLIPVSSVLFLLGLAARGGAIMIDPPYQPTAGTLTPCYVGREVNYPFCIEDGNASVCTQPANWIVVGSTLPAGIAFNTVTGQLEGTPTAAGTFGITLRAEDSTGGSDVQSYEVPIRADWEYIPYDNYYSPARDAMGWSLLPPAADARTVYVSSSTGNDANSGLSEADPVASWGAGESKLRAGFPDRMLLKRGDTFGGGAISSYRLRFVGRGRSASEPMVIGAYGDGPRPIISNRYIALWHNNVVHENLVFTGLHFRADTPPMDAFSFLGGATINNILIEDCYLEQASMNLNGGSVNIGPYRHNNITIYRTTIVDAHDAGGAHRQGLFADWVNGLRIEDCLLDNNGWRQGVAAPTRYNHNVYIQRSSRNVSISGSIMARGSSHGLQLRPGGVVEDCLFIQNNIAYFIGDAIETGANEYLEYGIGDFGISRRVVCVHADDKVIGGAQGYGADGFDIMGNVFDNILVAHSNPATIASRGFSGRGGLVESDIAVFNWANSPNEPDGATFPEPTRDIPSYTSAFLFDTPSIDGFLAGARLQSRDRYLSHYTAQHTSAWLREGFALPPADPSRPRAVQRTLVMTSGPSLSISLTAVPSQSDDPLALSVAEHPRHGTLSGNAPELVYTPNQDYIGLDYFAFIANEAGLASDPATIMIHVQPSVWSSTGGGWTMMVY